MNYVTSDEMNEYLRTVQPMYDGILGEIQAESIKNSVPIVPLETARLLSVIMTIKPPERVLEIGTAVGFSAGLISRYLKSGGSITTIDRYDVMLKDAHKNIERMGLDKVVNIIEGDAADILPGLEGKFDMIFLDAAKGQYSAFLPHIIRLLTVGGIFIADDVLQGGDIARSRFSVPRRQRTIHKRMRSFLWEVSHSGVFESAILPVGDGVALCCKVREAEDAENTEVCEEIDNGDD